MIDFEEIRKAVAIEHNNLLGKDDPILMSVTVHELVLQRYVDILVDRNMELLKTLEAAQQKGIADAKQTAGRVITDASNYVSEQVHTAVSSAMKEALAQIKKELGRARQETQIAKKTAVIAAAVSCICTVATVAVAINVF